jgi:hypothetical protein
MAVSRKSLVSVAAIIGLAAVAGITVPFKTSPTPAIPEKLVLPLAPPAPKKLNTLRDVHGVDLPRCVDEKGHKVEFLPQQHQYFLNHWKGLFSLEADPFNDDGAFFYYDYQELLKYPKEYRTHLIYTECAQYALDDGAKLDTKAWVARNLKAECIAAKQLRDDRAYTPEQMEILINDASRYAFFMQGPDRMTNLRTCLRRST